MHNYNDSDLIACFDENIPESVNHYIDKKGTLTDKYYEDKANGELKLAEEVTGFEQSVIEIIDSIYDPKAMQPENAHSNGLDLRNKYIHATYPMDKKQQQRDYAQMLKVKIVAILKMNQEFCLADGDVK